MNRSTLKKLLVFIVAIALGAAGVIAYLSRPDASGFIDLTSKSAVEIKITDKGFSPALVYITEGTTVTFSTLENRPFWPASDLHPSHTLYPEFDPREPIAKDKTWSFTFNKLGYWSMHDHLYAIDTGVIIVVPGGTPPSDWYRSAACSGDAQGRAPCWSASIKAALDAHGLDSSFDEIKLLLDNDPLFGNRCHSYAHNLGLLAFNKYGDNPPLSKKLSYCDWGFYHGYMEGFITKHSMLQDGVDFCARVRKALSAEDPLAYDQCVHGIGHGRAEYILHTRDDLWATLERVPELGLQTCNSLSDTTEKRRCAAGVYSVVGDWMLLKSGYETLFSRKDPFMLCRTTAKDEWSQDGCVHEFSKRIYSFWNGDTRSWLQQFPEQLAYLERKASELFDGKYTESAIEGFSNGITESLSTITNEQIVDTCNSSLTSIDDKAACLLGAARGLFYHRVPEEGVKRMVEFCISPALPNNERRACADATLNLVDLSYLYRSHEEICRELSSGAQSLKDICTNK